MFKTDWFQLTLTKLAVLAKLVLRQKQNGKFIFMGTKVIQSEDTPLTKDFSVISREDLVLCAVSTQDLNSENGNLLPETGSIVQPCQQTAQQLQVKAHDNLLSRLASGYSISCVFFHFLQI